MKSYLVIIFILILFISCNSPKIKPKVNSELDGKIPSQESWNSQIYFSEKEKLQAVLFSDHIRIFEDEKETLLEGVKVNFYDENGVQNSRLTSKRGRVDDATRDMYAIDSVVAVSDSGITLITNELVWKSSKSKIYSDKFVRIISEKEIIEGYGFEADQNLNNYVIYDIVYTAEVQNEKKVN